ncbi:MAG: SDR family oxidoreductase [Chloroflexi bacterium]|nr:SDR family oxidoreductase [Chloroflexota bacterium]
MKFQGKTALVTGSATSIGFAIARTFLDQGANVVVNSNDQQLLDAALSRLASHGDRVAGQRADVRVRAEVQALVAKSVDQFGRVDILVNCAGVSTNGLVVDLPEEEWDFVLDTNLKGPYLVSQAAAKVMLEAGRGGRIVNITSAAGRSARAGAAHYAASKAGLILLTQTLALELGRAGITVNAVAPGLILSDDKVRKANPDYVAAFSKSIPVGYTGEPTDIANAVVFLASDEARYVTGEVLAVDGGVLAGRYFLPENTKA